MSLVTRLGRYGPAASWVEAARARAHRPALAVRLPFVVNGQAVGSVESVVMERIASQGLLVHPYALGLEGAIWHLRSEAQDSTAALNALAAALREVGACGPWRNEQLAVSNESGERIGTTERGTVRVLGIASTAVHLIGVNSQGDMWVQQRSLVKPNNPGMWDTLMGGMVSAADTMQLALERETWEEAGLRIADLIDVTHGGHVDFSHPSEEGGDIGFMRERIDWFSACIPDGLEPCNQDGEVERFELIGKDELLARLARGEFTPEASLVLAAYFGW